MLSIVTFSLGPVMTNCYLVADPQTGEAVVIDPADEGHTIVSEAERRGCRVRDLQGRNDYASVSLC